jgi:hypothetical protein
MWRSAPFMVNSIVTCRPDIVASPATPPDAPVTFVLSVY